MRETIGRLAQPCATSRPCLRRGRRYSPDFNTIEQLFAKLNVRLKKAAERTVGALWDRIGLALDTFKLDECAKYFVELLLTRDDHPPMTTVGHPMAILFGGPTASTIVSPMRQADSLLMKTV